MSFHFVDPKDLSGALFLGTTIRQTATSDVSHPVSGRLVPQINISYENLSIPEISLEAPL